MSKEQFIEIAASNNPFIETCYGLTRLFVENGALWIEFQNEYGFYSQQKTGTMNLNELRK